MQSGTVQTAVLESGDTIEYVYDANAPRGGMKHTYFTPDRQFAVQFFNNPRDGENPRLQDRIRTIVGIYNPTLSEQDGGALGNTEKTAEYFRKRFCWPVAIVKQPQFGIVCPTYPQNFFFGDGASSVLNLKGKDKKSNWFTGRNRKYLAPEERGDFRTMLKTAIGLSRTIRRMHQAGLAHSDLSCNNVLIDPKTGVFRRLNLVVVGTERGALGNARLRLIGGRGAALNCLIGNDRAAAQQRQRRYNP